MARSFNGSSEFLRIASALGLTEPFAFFARVDMTNLAVNQTLISLSDGSNDAYYMIYRTATQALGADSNDQGIASAEALTVGGFAAGFSACYTIWASTSDRRARVETTTAANANLVTPDSMSEINVARYNAAIGSYSSSVFAALAFWSVELTTDEQLSLVKGFSPRRIRPQSLVLYAPLIRDVIDIRGGATFATATGSVATHNASYGY